MIIAPIITILILTCTRVYATSFTVTPSNLAINILADYLWNIDFSPVASRPSITLTFPNNISLTGSTQALYNSAPLTVTARTASSITFQSSILAAEASAAITITNVMNPPSAVKSTTNFTISSAFQTGVQLPDYNSVSYSYDALAGCSWAFSLCTEQPNSLLTITIVTTNTIYAGNNQIWVGYGGGWANNVYKNLMFQVTTFSCAFSLTGVSYTTVSCSNNVGSTQITLSLPITATLAPNSTIYVRISGVQSPPTQTTPLSPSYFVATADSSGFQIDQFTSCNIQPVCVTNATNGIFTTSPLTVNQVLTEQQINFNSYPIITVLPSDVVSIHYNPSSDLNNCTVLKFWRAVASLKLLTLAGALTFQFPSTGFQIIDTSFPIYLYIACSAIELPGSRTPTDMTFTFQRSGSQYLILTATITVTAAALNTTTAGLTLSSSEMAHTGTDYLFSFITGQLLGTNPSVVIGFPGDAGLVGATCGLKVNGTTVSTLCSVSGSTLTAAITFGTVIPSGSIFGLTVSGLVNPPLSELYDFSITTYYNSSDSNSEVETASPAVNATFTTITSLIPTLSPSFFMVYGSTTTTITITTPIALPAHSFFSLSFPAAATQLSSSSQPLYLNGTAGLVVGTAVNSSGNSISFSNVQAIPANTTLLMMVTLRAPAVMGTYSYVQLSISNTITYIESMTSLVMVVNIPSTIPVSITVNNPTAGKTSSYDISLTYTVPHPATFDLTIDFPSDTSYLTSIPGTCTPNCVISSFAANGSQLILTITNPTPGSTIITTQTYTVSTINNRRYVGAGSPINITTSVGSQIVTSESATALVSAPGVLTGTLDPSASYYRNNSAPVSVSLNLTSVNAGDYFLFTMSRSTYTGNSVLCSPIYGICSVSTLSTSNILVINFQSNLSSYSGNPLHLIIQGLTSGLSTNYFEINYITVGHYCSEGLVQTGMLSYELSCSTAAGFANQCATCYSNGTCISCYTAAGYYLYNGVCITSCGDATRFLLYASSSTSTCELCAGNCLTCTSASACLSCLDASYFLYTDSLTCQPICTSLGYTNTTLGSQPLCTPCADPYCLQCTSLAYASCTLCNNISTLVNSACSSTCPGISYYISSSQCQSCDPACYTCVQGTAMDCQRCSVGYVNNSGTCAASCPIGTAAIPSQGVCGCYTPCLTCVSTNYISCTSCVNTTLFVYLGQCTATCPNGTYLSGMSCLPCSTGCASCQSTVCAVCLAGWLGYNGQCYSSCGEVGLGYVASGGTCVQCPSGCSSCGGGSCSSCLQQYTLVGATCVESCSLTGTCGGKVVPLPGSIALAVWVGTVVVLRFAAPTTYTPYALLMLSAVIQFALTIAVLAVSGQSTVRLLAASTTSNTTTIVGLFGTSLAINYLTNLIYLFIFLRYIKPLLHKPKQSDYISHAVLLIVCMLTNYRLCLLAYTRMCAKPRVPIDNSSRLTPVHYICVGSALLDLITVIGCGLLLYSQAIPSTLFMLGLDLLIVVLFNIIITIWFVASSKPDEYYKDKAKYEVEEENPTGDIMTNSNEKDISKINIVAVEDMRDDDQEEKEQDKNIDLGAPYNSIRTTKTRVRAKDSQSRINIGSNKGDSGNIVLNNDRIIQESVIETIENPPSNDKQKDIFAKQFQDADYQEIIPHKRIPQAYGNSKVTSMRGTLRQSRRYTDLRQSNNQIEQKFDKELYQSYAHHQINNNIFLPPLEEQSDLPDLDEVSHKGDVKVNQKSKSLKDHHKSQHLHSTKPQKGKKGQQKRTNISSILPKGMVQTENVRKVRQPSITTQNIQGNELSEDDFQAIVRQKVQQSTIKKRYEINIQESDDLQDISPSKYNAHNQRFRQNGSTE